MIQLKTLLNCIDNSGASIVECIANLRMQRHARIGDRIIVVVQKQRKLPSDGGQGGAGGGGGGGAAVAGGSSAAANTAKVRRGDIRHAVVVRTRKAFQRKNGVSVTFGDNACVLIQKTGEPIGSRVSGVVGVELRSKGWSKILSLATAHV